MISFTINKVKVDNVYKYEDEISILNRYALQIVNESTDSLQVSPRFLRFDDLQEFTNGGRYKVFDIRDELKELDISDISITENMTKLIIKYPRLNTKDIGLLWLYAKELVGLDSKEFVKMYEEKGWRPYFLSINRHEFGTAVLLHRSAIKYITQIKDELEGIRRKLTKESRIYKDFNSVTILPPTTNFKLEETSEETFLHLPNGESVYDVFNAMDMSQNIPFAMLVDQVNNRRYFKVFGDILPPKEWIDRYVIEGLSRCIYFYVLDSKAENISFLSESSIVKLYSEGIWKTGNSIELLLKLESDESSDDLKNKILMSVKNRIVFTIGETVQMSIKGTFSMPRATLNAAVFADLVFSNESMAYYIFFNEQKKSVLNKKRFSFYYQHGHQSDYNSALTVTLTQSGTITAPTIDVRIARAFNKKQIDTFMVIFQRLYGIYTREYDNTIKLYKGLYEGAVLKAIVKKSVTEKENKKSGARLLALQSHNLEAFSGSYSEKCQSKKQPYLVSPEQLKDVKKKLKSKGLGKDGLLEWPLKSGNMYACYPREKDEVADDYIWPGVVAAGRDAHYGKYPFRPCCFLTNQNKKETKKQIVTDRPLGENKLAPADRIAELPYYLYLVATSAGYKKADNKKYTIPIVRYGVAYSPDSFIHCLEQATNTNYIKADTGKKNKIVTDSLKALSELDNYAIGRQELFGVDTVDIRSHLSTTGSYIDPDLYVSILEKKYNRNIIVFKMDKENISGELAIPRYSNVYLTRALDLNRDTIIIIKYGVPDEWPYQCELMVKYNKKDSLEYSFNSKDPIIDLISSIRNEINTVYMTSPSGTYKKYAPIAI